MLTRNATGNTQMSGYYSTNPHYAPPSHEQAERIERAEAEAGRLFASAVTAQTADLNRVLAALAPYRGRADWEHSRDIALASWRVATAEARALCEESMADLLRDGEVSAETFAKWDALAEREKAAAQYARWSLAGAFAGLPELVS
jgi:small-conductance mechanosensitive channel